MKFQELVLKEVIIILILFIPERLIIDFENDLIIAYLRGLENDGRHFLMYDYEGLKEIDVEAYCIRISKLKNEIRKILEEIMDFLMEYEWEEEVIFERSDDKFNISAFLYEDDKTREITVSLGLSLKISGLHPMGDTIFDSEFDVANDELKIYTDSSDYNVEEVEIQEIFSDCWDEIRRYFLLEKEIEKELLNEIDE